MKTISVTKLCGITTITDISTDTFYTDSCIKIYVKQDIKKLPYLETIQDVLINMKTVNLEIFKSLLLKH